MNLRTLLILVVLAALAVFAAVNWAAFTAPASLSLVFGTVQAPLGVILLAAIAGLSVLFLAYVVYLQGTVLLETRRAAREVQAQRDLADKAEESRFTELRTYVATEIARLHERIDRLDRDFGDALERTESATAAYMGELGDRVDRLRGGP